MASPLPAAPSPLGRSRSGGAKTPLKSPLGRTLLNDDDAEKERAAKARAANELRRRCARAFARARACSAVFSAPAAGPAARAGPGHTLRQCCAQGSGAAAQPVGLRGALTPLHARASHSLDGGRENELPSGAAKACAGKAGEPAPRPVATLSTVQVLDLYSNWCAPLFAHLATIKPPAHSKGARRQTSTGRAGAVRGAWSANPLILSWCAQHQARVRKQDQRQEHLVFGAHRPPQRPGQGGEGRRHEHQLSKGTHHTLQLSYSFVTLTLACAASFGRQAARLTLE